MPISGRIGQPYVEGVKVGRPLGIARLERLDRPREELSRLLLQMQQVGGGQLVESAPQGRAVGPEEEELAPETLRVLSVTVCGILVVLSRISRREGWCAG